MTCRAIRGRASQAGVRPRIALRCDRATVAGARGCWLSRSPPWVNDPLARFPEGGALVLAIHAPCRHLVGESFAIQAIEPTGGCFRVGQEQEREVLAGGAA